MARARSLLDAPGAETKKGTVLLWRDNALDQHHRFPADGRSQRRPTLLVSDNQNGTSFNLYVNIDWTGPCRDRRAPQHRPWRSPAGGGGRPAKVDDARVLQLGDIAEEGEGLRHRPAQGMEDLAPSETGGKT